MIDVKVVKVPGAQVEVALEDGATVREALEYAGKTVDEGQTVQVNGTQADLDTPLTDGARVVIAKGAKGNR